MEIQWSRFAPMRAKSAENLFELAREGYHIEPKYDGDRAIVVKRGEEVVMLTSSGRDVSCLVPSITAAVADYPYDMALDGEVAASVRFVRYRDRRVPIADFAATRSVMGSSASESLRKQRSMPLTFIAFDVLDHIGEDLRRAPDAIRRATLNRTVEWFRSVGCSEIILSPRWADWDLNEPAKLIEAGAEGAVLKNPRASYQSGRRPEHAWYKAKRRDTLDAVVAGFTMGKGSFSGTIGAIILEAKVNGRWKKIGQVSGMDMATREAIARDPSAYLGRVVEVAHTGRLGEGLRHPRFVRFRADKEPDDCEAFG